MSEPAHGEWAALRAALVAAEASFEAARTNLTAATSVRAALKAALGEAVEGEVIDLEDRHLWLTIPQAAGVARCSEKTVWRDRHETGVLIGGRWYINRHKLLANRASRAR